MEFTDRQRQVLLRLCEKDWNRLDTSRGYQYPEGQEAIADQMQELDEIMDILRGTP